MTLRNIDQKLKTSIIKRGQARPQGLWGTLRAIVEVGLLTAIRQRLACWRSLIAWIFLSFWRAVTGPRPSKRLLIVYDLRARAFSLDDMLWLQAGAAVVRERWCLDRVDYAAIHENAPLGQRPATNAEDAPFFYRLNEILPVAQVNPHLGSVFVFDSMSQFEGFRDDNTSRYRIWPGLASGEHAPAWSGWVFGEVLQEHVERHGRLPILRVRPAMANWARQFYADRLAPGVMACVDLSGLVDIEPWLRLIVHARDTAAVRFVVLGGREAVHSRLRDRENVLIARDFDASMEHEAALLEVAPFALGAGPGLITKTIFGDAPYAIFRTVLQPETCRGIFVESGHCRIHGSRPDQRLWAIDPTPELLFSEFRRMWASLDPDAWRAAMMPPTTAKSRTGK